MTYLRRLFHVELAAQISLAACALLFGIIMMGVSVFGLDRPFEGGDTALSAVGAAAVLAVMVYFYCVGPVALLVAPIYAALEARNRTNAVTSICTGLIPGLLMLLYSVTPFAANGSGNSLVTLGCLATGASIATGVHLIRTWNQSDSWPSLQARGAPER